MINFSIITPTYENPTELKIFLDSLVMAEKPGDFELIIVDDSPSDKIIEIVKKYNSVLPIKFIRLKKYTFLCEKKNIGAKKAKNEIIVFMDSDLIINQNVFTLLLQTMKNNPDIALFAGKVMQDGKQLQPAKNDRILIHGKNHLTEVQYGVFQATYKSIFSKIGGFDKVFEGHGEGSDLSIRYWRAGFPLGRNLDIVVHHPSFKSSRILPDRIKQVYRTLLLLAYKYDVAPELSPHLIEMYLERKDVYGEKGEFYALYAFSSYFDWMKKKYAAISKSKKNVSQLYDFKPFDVFSDEKSLKICLLGAAQKIRPAYVKVFGGK